MASRSCGRIVVAALIAAVVGVVAVWGQPTPVGAQTPEFGPWSGTLSRTVTYSQPRNGTAFWFEYGIGTQAISDFYQVNFSPSGITESWQTEDRTTWANGCVLLLTRNVSGPVIVLPPPNTFQVVVDQSSTPNQWMIGFSGERMAYPYMLSALPANLCIAWSQEPTLSAEVIRVPVINLTVPGAADATSLTGQTDPGCTNCSIPTWTYNLTRQRLGPPPNPKGEVIWGDAYPDRFGQGVQGATVKVGNQTFQTDAQGEYEITSDLVGQAATVTLPIFDHSDGSAFTGPADDLVFTKSATSSAARSSISMTINEQIKLDIDPNTGKIKPTASFGKNVQFKGFGQTFNLTNLKLTDEGVETVGGTAQLAFKYDANSPPITLAVNLQFVKSTNTLTIDGVAGSQFQWAGQTATLTKFALVSSPDANPPVNSVSIEGSVNLSVSGVPISAILDGKGTAQGVVITAVGNAVVQGITVEFNPITVENGQFRVKGRVKLPNQTVYLEFDTLAGFGAPNLVLPLPLFQWDGQALPVELVLRGSGLILRGKGNVQIGGQAVELTLDTNVNLGPGTTTVRASASMPLPDGGSATANLEFDPAKPQNAAVTGAMKIFLALCPSKKTEFSVDVRASAANIKLGFTTSIPIDCDGNGTSTLVDIRGDFDGQLAQLKVSWPVTVGNTNGRVSTSLKGDGTFFEIMFNLEVKFGPGAPRAPSSVRASDGSVRPAAATDVRILLTDGVGRRTGFDPATGQIVNEIPGGRWDGLVLGMDTFTMPGRVGGYGVTLLSSVAQQVELVMTVGGQTTSIAVSLAPGVGTAIAAETVPQNGGPTLQIGPVAVGCGPRPRVQITAAPGGGALRATFSAEAGSSLATNAIREIRIGPAVQNGLVDANGQTGLRAGAVITFPSPATSVTLTVRRERPNEATTVPLTIVDGCGEWKTFVGGGAQAW